MALLAALATFTEAAPAQRDPWAASPPEPWSRDPEAKPTWSDAAPVWSEPHGDQAQQGRTWATPRRGQGAVSGVPAVPGADREPVPAAAGEPSEAGRDAPAAPRRRADEQPKAPAKEARPAPSHSREPVAERADDEAVPPRRPRVARSLTVLRPARRSYGRRFGDDAPRFSAGLAEGEGSGFRGRRGDGYAGRYAGGPPFYPLPPYLLPPACPLIIKVGRGLANPVRSEIIGGRPNCR